jgi:hypothetical protein
MYLPRWPGARDLCIPELVNHPWDKMQKEIGVALFQVVFRRFPGGTEEDEGNSDSR